MKRLKILILTSIVLVALLGLTNSFIEPEYSSGREQLVAINQVEKQFPGRNEMLLYHKQKKELESAVAAYFDKAIASGAVVGVGVSIVKGDSIVISKGFGKRNIKNKETVDGHTIFRLGSLSKGFAGILAANLENEGKLSWEDKVKDYIPEFQLGDQQNTEKITLANILSHTAGAPYHSYTNLVEAG